MRNYPSGYYRSLVNDFIDYPNPAYSQIDLVLLYIFNIKKDLNRTFGGDKSAATEQNLKSLKNILNAYVNRNPTVGYCQGFNFVVAHLLRHMGEEEAFWVFCCIIENVLPLDYFTYMLGVLVDQGIFRNAVKDSLPNVWTLLKKHNMDPSLVSMQWFICLYTQNIQPEVADTLWDHMFLQGSKILFKAGLAMLCLLEKNILKCNEFGIFHIRIK